MAPKEEATAPDLEAMPFAELVALAQSVGVVLLPPPLIVTVASSSPSSCSS
jgi:hypothetical protein